MFNSTANVQTLFETAKFFSIFFRIIVKKIFFPKVYAKNFGVPYNALVYVAEFAVCHNIKTIRVDVGALAQIVSHYADVGALYGACKVFHNQSGNNCCVE